MQILTNGSFINLDSEEKIEQLKFTARELANAAVETEGFINEEESNKRLGREFWEGLEYICRDHETISIKNLFINAFLEKLREFRTTLSGANSIPETLPAQYIDASAQEEKPTENIEDEFLGLISQPEESEEAVMPPVPDTQENDLELIEGSVKETDEFADLTQEEPDEPESSLAESFRENAVAPKETDEAVEESIDETGEDEKSADLNTNQTGGQNQSFQVANAVQLAEKEPYQFDKCTVTVTVQLFPVTGSPGRRKAALSVRTHDFAPQISMVELSFENGIALAMTAALETALAAYQRSLPVRVMDKMKKDKNKPSKPTPKSAAEQKPVVSPASKPEIKAANPATPTKAEAPVSTNVKPVPAVSSGEQGSLFGV